MEQTTSTSQRLQRDWQLFTALSFLFSFGFAVYSGVFQNFLRDELGATPLQLGQLESLREIPGLLAAITAGTLAALAESRIAGLGLIITAIGIAFTGDAALWAEHLQPGGGAQTLRFMLLVAVTVFWSVGFHLWASMSPAITLALSKGQQEGRNLGRMQSVGYIATIVALGLSWLCSQAIADIGYRPFFYIAGVAIAISGVLSMLLSQHSAGGTRAPIILRREYGLYYLMSFLEGCRRQIFGIFAGYTLIKVYHVDLKGMLALQLLNAGLIAITAPMMGRMIDKRGERGPLTFYSVALIVVFLGYAFVPNLWLLFVLYIVDNVLFTFSVGITTYLNRIVRPQELTPCISMGVTMNHIAAVTIPVGGAWLWQHFENYQIPFWIGAAIACIALIVTFYLPKGVAPARQPQQ